jgi:hypothetical protein
MNSELLTLLVKELSKSDSNNTENTQSPKKYHIGEPVIVRCRDAGVHCGILVDYYDRTAILNDSRRLWRWWSASEHTLSGVARHGIKQSESCVAGPLQTYHTLTETCEIIPFSNEEAYQSIKEAPVYNEQG